MSEPTSCELCGGREHSLYLSRVYAYGDREYDLVRCLNCGLVFVVPMPEIETIRKFYDAKYFESDFSCGMFEGSYLETEKTRVEEYREMLSFISEYCKGGRLLEVGCAAGSFLNYAKRAGFEVEGVDISSWAKEEAQKQYGINVHLGRLQEVQLKDKNYDVVFLSDLLEHEPKPKEFLKEVHRIMKDDGLVVIKVPTYVNSIYYRFLRRIPLNWTLGKVDARLVQALKLSAEVPKFPPYHLYEYSHKTLERLLSETGLFIVARRGSVIVPEFLEATKSGIIGTIIHTGFKVLRFLVRHLNIYGGHTIVFAKKIT